LTTAGNMVLIYEGQSPTCYGCNGTVHQFHDCPRRKQADSQQTTHKTSWTDIVQQRSTRTQPEMTQHIVTDKRDVPHTRPRAEIRDLPHRHGRPPAPTTAIKLTTRNETTNPEVTKNGMQTDEPPASKMLDKRDPIDDKIYTMAHDTMTAATHCASREEEK